MMEAINGSAGAARSSHQFEGGPDRHVKKLFVTFIDQEGGRRNRRRRRTPPLVSDKIAIQNFWFRTCTPHQLHVDASFWQHI